MIVHVKHVKDVVDRAADHFVARKWVAELDCCDILVMALDEATNRLLQLMDVPDKQILICPCCNQGRVGSNREKWSPTTPRIALCYTCIGSAIPNFDKAILARGHEDVD